MKHEDGTWGPKNKGMVIGTSLYTNPPTEFYLPSEVWFDLDLRSGVRRDNSRAQVFLEKNPNFRNPLQLLTVI